MKIGEVKTILKMLDAYIEHLMINPDSLLAKIFGVFTLRKNGFVPQHIMLMENTLQLSDRANQQFVYDLKGSTFKRLSKGKLTRTTMRKDIDFIKDKKENSAMLSFSKENRKLIKVVQKDVSFLKE